jgi:glyoxylase-like metal-dependent hydrolase (beta-lactamase superfamily II)
LSSLPFCSVEREPIIVDVKVTNGQIIDGGLPLEVIHAPGYTPGNIALYSKEHRTAIGGDCLFKSVLGMPGLFPSLQSNSIDLVAAVLSLGI